MGRTAERRTTSFGGAVISWFKSFRRTGAGEAGSLVKQPTALPGLDDGEVGEYDVGAAVELTGLGSCPGVVKCYRPTDGIYEVEVSLGRGGRRGRGPRGATSSSSSSMTSFVAASGLRLWKAAEVSELVLTPFGAGELTEVRPRSGVHVVVIPRYAPNELLSAQLSHLFFLRSRSDSSALARGRGAGAGGGGGEQRGNSSHPSNSSSKSSTARRRQQRSERQAASAASLALERAAPTRRTTTATEAAGGAERLGGPEVEEEAAAEEEVQEERRRHRAWSFGQLGDEAAGGRATMRRTTTTKRTTTMKRTTTKRL